MRRLLGWWKQEKRPETSGDAPTTPKLEDMRSRTSKSDKFQSKIESLRRAASNGSLRAQAKLAQMEAEVNADERTNTMHQEQISLQVPPQSGQVLPPQIRYALIKLDKRLVEVLRAEHIRLVRTAWLLQQPDSYRKQRRQDLEN